MSEASSSHFWSRFRIAWLQFLDRVKPRPGIGGSSPRVMVATPAEVERIEEILRRHRSFTGSCPIREHAGDGHYVGRCEFATYDGFCPRHGALEDYPTNDD